MAIYRSGRTAWRYRWHRGAADYIGAECLEKMPAIKASVDGRPGDLFTIRRAIRPAGFVGLLSVLEMHKSMQKVVLKAGYIQIAAVATATLSAHKPANLLPKTRWIPKSP
jgi:hypothetical protein